MFINVGHGNYVNTDEIDCIVGTNSNKIVRLLQENDDLLVHATNGKQRKSVIVMKSGRMIVCSLTAETLATRLNSGVEG